MKENNKNHQVGATPFGYARLNGNLVEQPSEQKVISRILELRSLGLGFGKIATELNKTFTPSKNYSIWYGGTVGAVLKRQPNKIENIQDCLCLNRGEL